MISMLKQQEAIFEAIKDTPRVSELYHQTDLEYKVSSFDNVLGPIISENNIIIVCGAYFGDEGKGKITSAFAENDLIDMILRANSGENAGHTVVYKGVKYVFHLTPSGIVVPGKTCMIGPECVMDPVNFFNKEVSKLIAAEIDYRDRLFVGNVQLVGPYHKIIDFALSPPNSSTLMGIKYAHESKVAKRGLRMDDLFNSKDAQARALKNDLDEYFASIKHAGKSEGQILEDLEEFSEIRKIPEHLFGFLEAKDKTAYVLDLYKRMVVENDAFPQRRDVNHMVRMGLLEGLKLLIESPQSYWLSNATEKHWRSSTSAQTHALGVLASTGININKYLYFIENVLKTPADSRVGLGTNPSSFVHQTYFSERGINNLNDLGDACSDFDAIQKLFFRSIQDNGILKPVVYKDKTGEYSISEAMAIASARQFGEKGATSGKPRVTGVLDCLAAAQVNGVQGPNLSISAMDRGDYQDYVAMTVAYVFHNPDGTSVTSNGIEYSNGDIIRIGDPYPCDNVLKYCHPIMKVMPGLKNSLIGADIRKPDEPLPEAAQNIIGTIEDLTGFEVNSIGNGKNTENMIYIEKVD